MKGRAWFFFSSPCSMDMSYQVIECDHYYVFDSYAASSYVRIRQNNKQ